ncbi:MAG: RagB/SusD family nutrient uptake outer membrane protein [Alistipes sp.]|nr:RagB/SusD family nutrient uptake outer membrane protein [Alistipes sp.]
MKKLIAILIAASSLVSCSDFLDRENPYKIESDYYFTDESSLEIYTNGLVISAATAMQSFVDGDKYADTQAWDGTYAYFRDNYAPTDASNWGQGNWSYLRSVNFYLDNMRKATASEAVMNHYEGVGRFFRAWFYYAKVRTFGAVPWYEHMIDATDEEALYKGRDNREEVCRNILADLNYACEHCLTDAKYRVQSSYIHKYVALALKARFCLYEGTFRKYHPVDPSTGQPWIADESKMYLQECAKACEELMASGVYSLTDNPAARATQYRDMFTNSKASEIYTNEFIWARTYNAELSVTHIFNSYMVNVQYGNYSFNRDFVNTYLMQDGTPFTTKYADYNSVDFKTECTGRDLRMTQTMRHPGFTRTKNGAKVTFAPDLGFAKTGYHPIKWLSDDATMDTNTSPCDNDVPLMRYAEVLLNYAEAKAELGEMTQDVWNKTIKPLRERAGVTSIYPTEADPYMVSYFQGKVTDAAILEVRRERGVEMTMENIRYDDIIRWRQGELFARPWRGIWIEASETELDLNYDGVKETMVTADKGNTTKMTVLYIDGASDIGHTLSEGTKGNIMTATKMERKWHDYKYVKPIPTSAIQENPNLQQNPGW